MTGGDDERYMRLALRQAEQAAAAGEVPVGAVIVHEGRVIGKAWNQTETLKDPTAHAEIIALTQAAAARGDWRLNGATLYVTKEPCVMCAGACVLARLDRVVWGMSDPLRGGAVSQFNVFGHPNLNHRIPHTAGVLEAECADLIKGFFRARRAGGDETDG